MLTTSCASHSETELVVYAMSNSGCNDAPEKCFCVNSPTIPEDLSVHTSETEYEHFLKCYNLSLDSELSLPPIATFSHNLSLNRLRKKSKEDRIQRIGLGNTDSKGGYHNRPNYQAVSRPSLKPSVLKRHRLRQVSQSRLCKRCGLKFNSNENVKRHMNIHLGLRPYVCNVCSKSYARTSERSKCHSRHNFENKHGKFMGPHEHKNYLAKLISSSSNNQLTAFEIENHIDQLRCRPYQCPICEDCRSYTDASSLRKHIRSLHPNQNVSVNSKKSQLFQSATSICEIQRSQPSVCSVSSVITHASVLSLMSFNNQLMTILPGFNADSKGTPVTFDEPYQNMSSVVIDEALTQCSVIPFQNDEEAVDLCNSALCLQVFSEKFGPQFCALPNSTSEKTDICPTSSSPCSKRLISEVNCLSWGLQTVHQESPVNFAETDCLTPDGYHQAIDLSNDASTLLISTMPMDLSVSQFVLDSTQVRFENGRFGSFLDLSWDPEPGFSFTDLLIGNDADYSDLNDQENPRSLSNYPELNFWSAHRHEGANESVTVSPWNLQPPALDLRLNNNAFTCS